MGEEVCASVIVKEGSVITEADIKVYSKGKVSFHFLLIFISNENIKFCLNYVLDFSFQDS